MLYLCLELAGDTPPTPRERDGQSGGYMGYRYMQSPLIDMASVQFNMSIHENMRICIRVDTCLRICIHVFMRLRAYLA